MSSRNFNVRLVEREASPEVPYIDAFDYAKEIELHREMLNKAAMLKAGTLCNNVPDPKIDRWNFVLFTFFFYGVSIGLPWNVFLPIINFFVNLKLSSVDDRFEKIFLLVLLMIWQVTFVFTNLINYINCKSKRCDQRDRIPFVVIMSIIVTISFIVYIIFNPTNWIYQFLILMSLVAFINSAAGGILFSSAFYTSSIFPMEYTNVILIGMSFSSLLNNLIHFINKKAPENMAMCGVTFFVLSLGCQLITFIAHFSLSLSPFYCYHSELFKVKQIFTKSSNTVARTSYSKVFFAIWPYLFCIWLTVFSTTIVFPFYQQNITPVATDFFIDEKWFTEITCNLTFNVMFLLGNLTGQSKRKPSGKWIALLAVLKSLSSIAFFLFCNFESEKREHIPVLIRNDFVYWSVSGIFAYLSGYTISLLMMCTPNQIKEHYSSAAALLSSLMLVIGILSGLQFSRILKMAVLF